jgi:hypothetical protein
MSICRTARLGFHVMLLALTPACGGVPTESSADPVLVSADLNDVGVPDHGLDPSALALTNARGEVCSAVLLASNVVLTARHCVMEDPLPLDCATIDFASPLTVDPATLQVSAMAASAPPASASGAAVLTSDDVAVCGADVAVVILSSAIDGVLPALVSESGIAAGSHVRTVGIDITAAESGISAVVVREHVTVLDVSTSEFAVKQATCVAAGGSPAYDETTGQVVGVLSRWGTECGAPAQFDVFTRMDVFYGLVQEGLEWAPALSAGGADGGIDDLRDAGRKRDAGHAKKPPTDIGAACLTATDCGTGLCVTAEGSQYCSRTCAPADHCPTDFTCVVGSTGISVCVQA